MKRLKIKVVQPIIYLVLLLGVLVLMVSMRHCKRFPTESSAAASDTLHVGVLYEPLSYYLYADTLGGLNYDLLKAFSRDTHTPLKIHPVYDLRRAIAALETGKLQIVAPLCAGSLPGSKVLFSESLFTDRMLLVQRCGPRMARSALDLAGDSVYVEQDSPAIFRLRNLQPAISDTIYIIERTGVSAEKLVEEVAAGKIRMAVVSETAARPLLEEHPELSADSPVSFTLFRSWAASGKNERLINKVDKWVSTFKESKAYRQLSDRYGLSGLSTENKKTE